MDIDSNGNDNNINNINDGGDEPEHKVYDYIVYQHLVGEGHLPSYQGSQGWLDSIRGQPVGQPEGSRLKMGRASGFRHRHQHTTPASTYRVSKNHPDPDSMDVKMAYLRASPSSTSRGSFD